MIDHSRAFACIRPLQDEKALQRCDSACGEAKELDDKTLK